MSEPIRIEAEILRLTAERGPDRSICPTEVARALMPGPGEAWRRQLDPVRRAAVRLAAAGLIDILRKGRPVDPASFKGVIRLRARAGASEFGAAAVSATRGSPPETSAAG